MDSQELEDFLNQTAGPNAWFMTSVWMFARAPQIMRPGFMTVPIICPKEMAAQLTFADQQNDRPRRVYGEHVVGAVELRGWRWVAAQVFPRPDAKGVFPWEQVAIEGRMLHA
jgi:hypothetical protein